MKRFHTFLYLCPHVYLFVHPYNAYFFNTLYVSLFVVVIIDKSSPFIIHRYINALSFNSSFPPPPPPPFVFSFFFLSTSVQPTDRRKLSSPPDKACVGHRVALYFVGFGNEFDVHSIHFHGQTLSYQHTR